MSNGDRLAWRLLHAVSQFDASQEPTLWIGVEHEDGTRTPAMAIWSSGEYLPDVMARLVDAMQQNGEYPGDHVLDTTTLVGDLLNTVEVAIKARDGASGSTGIGGVAEVLNSEWVLTERGMDRLVEPRVHVSAKQPREPAAQDAIRSGLESTDGPSFDEAWTVAAAYHASGKHGEATRSPSIWPSG